MNTPIIRLEIQGMRNTISAMLSEHTIKADIDIKAAVDAFCTPENITTIVQAQAKQVLDSAIRAEVDAYYRHGKGRTEVLEAVKVRLGEGSRADRLQETLAKYMDCVNVLNEAMRDGVNVQGAVTNMLGVEREAQALLAGERNE